MKSNSLSWCPTLPTVLLLASEDHNLYTFDIRNLASPTQIYKDHVAAVMSCDWSESPSPLLSFLFLFWAIELIMFDGRVVWTGPTGEEFVSGGWDRSIRIWNRADGRSKDVYHTKRMQRFVVSLFPPLPPFFFYQPTSKKRLLLLLSLHSVMDVAYTPTSTFVMSASDDGNIRLWKSKASASLGVVDSRERASREYRAKLTDKWGKTDAVRRIEKFVYFFLFSFLLLCWFLGSWVKFFL